MGAAAAAGARACGGEGGSGRTRTCRKGRSVETGEELVVWSVWREIRVLLRWEPGRLAGKEPSRPGMPPSRHAAKQGCLLLFLRACNGDLVVTKNESA